MTHIVSVVEELEPTVSPTLTSFAMMVPLAVAVMVCSYWQVKNGPSSWR